jgi:hypothetical protein
MPRVQVTGAAGLSYRAKARARLGLLTHSRVSEAATHARYKTCVSHFVRFVAAMGWGFVQIYKVLMGSSFGGLNCCGSRVRRKISQLAAYQDANTSCALDIALQVLGSYVRFGPNMSRQSEHPQCLE